ncbi:MAG: hypothetical protein HC887_04465 [Desulfobacteraceae bacterium]|nr:hypothetical protein [Desulfobacteraceae bacterium]
MTTKNTHSSSAAISAIFLLMIAICSGCSGSTQSKDSDKMLRVRLSDYKGNTTDKISIVSPGYVIASLKDFNGKPVSKQMIAFTTTLGTLEVTSALTDENGEAKVGLSVDPDKGGVGKVTIVDTSSSNTSDINFTVTKIKNINIILKLFKATLIKDENGTPVRVDMSQGTKEGIGEETRQISATSPGMLRANLSYIDEQDKEIPIDSQQVTFTTTTPGIGYIFPTSGIAVSDKNGAAVIGLLSGLKAGDGEAVITFKGYKVTLKYSVVSEEMYISLQMVGKESYEAYPKSPDRWEKLNTLSQRNSPAYLIATLRYVSENPVQNKAVQFKTTLGGIWPTSDITPPPEPTDKLLTEGKALTDADGRAAMLIYAGAKAGAGEATANFEDNFEAKIGFTSVGDETISLSLKLAKDSEGREEITEISQANPGYLVATLSYGPKQIPIVNQSIAFSSTMGSIRPKAGTAVTDNTGKAYVTLLPGWFAENAALPGVATATYTTYTANVSFKTWGDGKANLSLQLTDPLTDKITQSLKTEEVGQLDAVLQDDEGNSIAGATIQFYSAAGLVTIQPSSAVTDKDGKASAVLSAGKSAGSETVTATADKFRTSSSVYFPIVKTSPSLSLQMTDSGGNTTDTMTVHTSGTLTAMLLDADKKPMSNQIVNFSATLSGVTLQSSSVVTDSEGKAKVLISAGLTTGSCNAKAIFGETSAAWVFTVTDKGIAVSFELFDSSGTATQSLTTGSAGVLKVVLEDVQGNALRNAEIIFSAASLITIAPPAKVTTDKDGKASVTLIADTAGLETVTVKLGTKVIGSSAILVVEPEEESSERRRLPINISITLLNNDGNRLEAQLTDKAGIPMVNRLVSFTADPKRISFSPADGMALTDQNGKASVRAERHTAGIVEVWVSYENYSAAVGFGVR